LAFQHQLAADIAAMSAVEHIHFGGELVQEVKLQKKKKMFIFQ